MKASRLLLFAVTFFFASQSLVCAEPGWSFKNLIPGGSDKKPASEQSSMPNPFRAASNQLKKIGSGTKSALAKTKDVMPDWMFPDTRKNIQKSSQTVQGSFGKIKDEMRVAQRAVVSPFKQLAQLGQKEEDPGPQTVTDFLKQDRPKF